MPTVLIVRHGETTWNRDGRMQGWAPTPLTDRGKEQARVLGNYLTDTYDIDRVVSSDLKRAVDTAESIAGNIDAEIETDICWREQDFGVYQGLDPERFRELVPDDDPTKPVKDGESVSDVRKRALLGLESFQDDDGVIVVVSHTGPVIQIIGDILGYDFLESYDKVDLKNASITEIEISDDGEVTLVTENVTEHFTEELETTN